jgi:hypothetical protein
MELAHGMTLAIAVRLAEVNVDRKGVRLAQIVGPEAPFGLGKPIGNPSAD